MSRVNSSSFFDDGNFLSHSIGRRSEDKVHSMQAEFSDRDKPNYYFNGGRISEEEIESERERRSTPPGSIRKS